MLPFGLVVLYVKDVAASTHFYRGLLGTEPVESSANFAMFPMPPVMLGLWQRDEVKPAPAGAPGALELDFTMDSTKAVLDYHGEWVKRGLKIAQEPVEMDFGHTFVALDPDGHRLRVLAPNPS
ncbi:MAG: VOC family protein [Proteobacteria bacterium]|nr:VOC family protein [Pseudomonadota bacterium]